MTARSTAAARPLGSRRPRSRRPGFLGLGSLGLGSLLLALAVLLPASPASAHTRLASSSPAPGAVVPGETGEVVLAFDGAVRAELTRVAVTGPDGAEAAQGAPAVRGTDVVQALSTPLPAGEWTVTYRVVADDGHPISGTIAFTVSSSPAAATPSTAGAVPDPTPDTRPARAGAVSPAPAAAQQPDADSDDGGSLLAPTLAGLVVVAVAGALLLRRRSRRGRA